MGLVNRVNCSRMMAITKLFFCLSVPVGILAFQGIGQHSQTSLVGKSLRVNGAYRARSPSSRHMRGTTMMADRVPIIAGNWKMNMGLDDAESLARDVVAAIASDIRVDVAIIPPHIYLADLAEIVQGSSVAIGG